MPHVPYVEPADASPEVREVYEKALRGKPGSFQKLLAHRPELLKNFVAFDASVGRSLERRLFELLYIRVSQINQCGYCLQHHLASSKRANLVREDSEALQDPQNSPRFSVPEKVALAYAEEVTRGPVNAVGNTVEALKQHFYAEQVVDIVATVALANLTNRMTDPLGAELEFTAEKI